MKRFIVMLGAIALLVSLSYAKDVKRYKRHGDMVQDAVLNLTWQDDSSVKSTEKTWEEAKKHCQNLTLGGYSDWRLPNIKELLSITDVSRSKPAIKKVFKNVANEYYWSSTSSVSDTSNAWAVEFDYGDDDWDGKSETYYIRCVR